MRKFVAKIEVWLDDSEATAAANGFVNTFHRPKDRHDGPEMFFQIHLPQNKKGNNPETLAHELGHVVAHVYKTDPSLKDDMVQQIGGLMSRFTPLQFSDFKPAMEIKLGAEKEAWEIAHKIYPDIPPDAEKDALATYEKAIAEAPFK